MKIILFPAIALLITATSFAQNKKINLADDPQKASIPKSNAQLLQDAKQNTAVKSDSISSMKVAVPTTVSPNSSSQIDQNGQRLNTQSSEINLGNKKATSTIHYDNSGRVIGSGTSIELGK